jgi:hypothetical protein
MAKGANHSVHRDGEDNVARDASVICKIMNQKAIKIYFYPLLVITLSILPWWAFSKYLLKFNFISFLASSTNTSYTAAIIYCLVLVLIFYTGWVFVNMWIENAKSQDEREKRIESLFINPTTIVSVL